MKSINIRGVLPAAILPMTANFSPDYKAYARYLDWLIAEKAVTLAINMDTGEGPQLKSAERRRAVEVAVDVARGRCAVVAGVLGATTSDAVDEARMVQEAGADGLVIFPNAAFRNEPLDWRIPFYFHKVIADATDLPIILFQLAPIFGGVNYTRETLLHLLKIPQIVGIKEASFDAQYFAYTQHTLELCDRHILLLTGNDRFITESFLLGADGALLGFCAIGCRMVAEMLENFHQGNYREAMAVRPRLQAFADFIYKDPMLDYRARCKAALAHIGVLERGHTYVRPPLFPISDEEYPQVGEALRKAGMLAK